MRQDWDGEAIMGERCRVYFGQPTPVTNQLGVVACMQAYRGSVGGPLFLDLSSHTSCRIIRSNTKPAIAAL